MTLVTVSHHFGLMWVGVEATTLASAPLIYFHRQHRSLEATWKYLLICSVGIALALLGNFFLAVAAGRAGRQLDGPLSLSDLSGRCRIGLIVSWLKAAFLFFLVGYGTKMGLAPLHTWLPDAHSEAPSVVSALLSGALLNCAFLAILRVHRFAPPPGEAAFSQGLLVFFGLISMGVAAMFILGQADFKRMLAYSSVEHMGILALGVGHRRRRRLRRPAARRQSFAHQGHAVSRGRQHPGRLRYQVDPRRARACCGRSLVGRALAGRLSGDHRLAAVRRCSSASSRSSRRHSI